MNFKRLSPVLLALGLSAAANAAVTPLRLPTVNGYAVALPGVSILPLSMPGVTVSAVITVPTLNAQSYPVSAPASLPIIRQIPTISPARLPGVPSPLPLPTPIVLSAVKSASPSADEPFELDWGMLDGKSGGTSDGESAGELVTVDEGPKTPKPAGAMNELRDASRDRKAIRVLAEKAFDGRRETTREIALPHAKFF